MSCFQINWRPVVWGLALQMCLGLLTLRTGPGRESFQFLGRQMEAFLNHVMDGVLFVFGEKYEDFFFIFKVMNLDYQDLFILKVMNLDYQDFFIFKVMNLDYQDFFIFKVMNLDYQDFFIFKVRNLDYRTSLSSR